MSKEQKDGERLIELFWPFVEHTTGEKHDPELEKENVKACAAICVRQIIGEINYIEFQLSENCDGFKDHWNKVLNHITHE